MHEPDVRRWSFSSIRGVLGSAGPEEPLPAARAVDDRDVPTEAAPGNDEGGFAAAPTPAGDGEQQPEDAFATSRTLPGPSTAAEPSGSLVGLAGGTEVGTVVHGILERVDLAAADLAVEVRREVEAVPPRRLALLEPQLRRPELVDLVTSGLVAALETPMDQVAPGLRLRDLAPGSWLAEPPFDLPLGDTHAAVALRDVVGVVADHLDPGPVRDGFAALAAPGAAPPVAGWLTGVADLVVRLPDGRFAVLDHKTNRLTHGRPGQLAPPQRYDQPMLEHTARHDLYMLQGLLYLTALHRWLEHRMSGYDPEAHLGGFGLLFLRGMAGPATPRDEQGRRDGVWWWRPPAAAVVAAARVLGGGRP